VLDLYDLCTDELKTKLEPKRKEFQEIEDKKLEAAKKQKTADGKQEEKPEKKEKMIEIIPSADELTNEIGKYELAAVLTHKGRMADSGHYVAWVKEAEDKWVKYDDDVVSYCPDEDIKKLSGKGGGDWHMAYLIIYRTKKLEAFSK